MLYFAFAWLSHLLLLVSSRAIALTLHLLLLVSNCCSSSRERQGRKDIKPQRPKTSNKGTQSLKVCMGESGRNSGKTLLCFALLCFCAHEQHCTHQMKPQKTRMLLRSQAVQHGHDRRWHAVAWLMGQTVQHWHCFRRIRTTKCQPGGRAAGG